jgi:triosephosphate isomerase
MAFAGWFPLYDSSGVLGGKNIMIYLIANWKMNLNTAEARELAAALRRAPHAGVQVIVAPPFTSMEAVSGTLAGEIGLAAQNIYPAESGPVTGEIGAAQLEEFDVHWVILGHSERRALLGETDGMIRRKLEFTLAKGLAPILCVGETQAERETGRAEAAVGGQLQSALAGLSLVGGGRSLLIAYEPVWAIGTGQVAAPETAAAMHRFIRETGARLNIKVAVLYGGSVTPPNIGELLAGAECDGFLVGGASLNADQFLQLAAKCAGAKE